MLQWGKHSSYIQWMLYIITIMTTAHKLAKEKTRSCCAYVSDSWKRELAWVTLKLVTFSRRRTLFQSTSVMYRQVASKQHEHTLSASDAAGFPFDNVRNTDSLTYLVQNEKGHKCFSCHRLLTARNSGKKFIVHETTVHFWTREIPRKHSAQFVWDLLKLKTLPIILLVTCKTKHQKHLYCIYTIHLLTCNHSITLIISYSITFHSQPGNRIMDLGL